MTRALSSSRGSRTIEADQGGKLSLNPSEVTVESPEPQYVWVKYAADELPAAEGLEYVGDYGRERPAGAGQAGTSASELSTVHATRHDHAVDAEALASTVAARVVAALRLAGQTATATGSEPTTMRRMSATATNRNLVTTEEFAASVDCSEASVFELLKLGLPSIKSRGLGRRILKDKATEWLISGGAARSRVAKKIAKAARTKSSTEGGDRG